MIKVDVEKVEKSTKYVWVWLRFSEGYDEFNNILSLSQRLHDFIRRINDRVQSQVEKNFGG